VRGKIVKIGEPSLMAAKRSRLTHKETQGALWKHKDLWKSGDTPQRWRDWRVEFTLRASASATTPESGIRLPAAEKKGRGKKVSSIFLDISLGMA